jgi:hypothetical protein
MERGTVLHGFPGIPRSSRIRALQGEDNVSVDDEFDLSQWNPGSPGAIRAHGERLAMSPSDFSAGVVYGDELQPRRRF